MRAKHGKKILKKRMKKFPRFQADLWKRMNHGGKGKKKGSAPWRKPRGIECPVRRGFKGTHCMPKIGYRNNKQTRHMIPNGFYKFTVNNVKDLDMLLMHNDRYCAEIAHAVSSKNRKAIVERADALSVFVCNRWARMSSEEQE